MRYAIDIAPLGELADPAAFVRLARAAETAGWDGLSTWDTLGISIGTVAPDPFLALAAAASATERLVLITSVVALPRRRPHLVAQSAATLDLISGGRLVLGIGAGSDPAEFETFGEDPDRALRLERLDEAAGLVDRMLRGETVTHEGPQYVVRGAAVGPRPVQVPRPPIWLGGMRPGAVRRAVRWDGWIVVAVSEDGSSMVLDPEAFGAMARRAWDERTAIGRADEAFDIAVFGFTEPGCAHTVAAFAEAGATWWLESLSPMRGTLDELVEVVRAGPPGAPGSG